MQSYMTFKEVRKCYKIEKNWHMPWHFSASGQYVCFLEGNRECYKVGDVYVVTERR